MKGNSRICYAIAIAFFAAALILELLPLGAVLIFAPGSGETIKQTFSYFDLTVMGYANFAPIITGVLTAAVIVLGIAALFRFQKAEIVKIAVLVCSVIAVLSSLAPLLFFGYEYMTFAGYIISAMMAVSVYLQTAADRMRGWQN